MCLSVFLGPPSLELPLKTNWDVLFGEVRRLDGSGGSVTAEFEALTWCRTQTGTYSDCSMAHSADDIWLINFPPPFFFLLSTRSLNTLQFMADGCYFLTSISFGFQLPCPHPHCWMFFVCIGSEHQQDSKEECSLAKRRRRLNPFALEMTLLPYSAPKVNQYFSILMGFVDQKQAICADYLMFLQ